MSRRRQRNASQSATPPAVDNSHSHHVADIATVKRITSQLQNGEALAQALDKTEKQISSLVEKHAYLSPLLTEDGAHDDPVSSVMSEISTMEDYSQEQVERLNQLLQDKSELYSAIITCIEQTTEMVNIALVAFGPKSGSVGAGDHLGPRKKRRIDDLGSFGLSASNTPTSGTRRSSLAGGSQGGKGTGSSSGAGGEGSGSGSSGIKMGAQVAFRLRPKSKSAEEEWIQCEVIRVLGEGARYEVQDPEPDENGKPGQVYKATVKDLIPIPASSEGLTSYPSGTLVLARYPETTTFYRGEVTRSRRDGRCWLKFEGEEEEGKETEVERRLVLPLPK